MNIPLARPLLDYMLELPSSDDPTAPLFPNAYAANRTGTLSNRFHDIMHSAGIVDRRKHQKSKDGRCAKRNMSAVSFHSLRHTAASALRNHGVTDVVAMAILGHESHDPAM
jgi:integrase